MTTRIIAIGEKNEFNHLATHPLQSYEWGEFRAKTDVKVVRVGEFDKDKLKRGYQLTIHKIPHTKYTIGYFPKGPLPDETMLQTLTEIGRKHNCICIKIEPNIELSENSTQFAKSKNFDIRIPYKGLFTKYSFVLDLTPDENTLLASMKEKTRYNIRLAAKKGVVVKEDNSAKAFDTYLDLTFETADRQGFYAHDRNYHKRMWETFGTLYAKRSGLNEKNQLTAHLFTAEYQKEILVTWILFLFQDVLYYPYGASSNKYREVMASNLMMWEAIKWGKSQGAKKFDMWGALAPEPDPHDPRIGFHRFKAGYGGRLVEFIGSYDLVLNPLSYQIYALTDRLRWFYLQRKKR